MDEAIHIVREWSVVLHCNSNAQGMASHAEFPYAGPLCNTGVAQDQPLLILGMEPPCQGSQSF